MRFTLVSSLVAGLVLVGGLAMARPPVHASGKKVIVTKEFEIPVTSEPVRESGSKPLACPASFTKSGSRFTDPSGAAWTGRTAKDGDRDRLGNDAAVAAIYRLAEPAFQTSVAATCVATVDGKPYLLAKKVDGATARTLGDEQLKRFGEGFVIDAWLGSAEIGAAWQVALDAAGNPVRTDAGGGGLFRAKGDAKGSSFGNDVPELQTMRDPLRTTSFGYRMVAARDVKEQLQRFATWYPAHRAEVDAAIDAAPLGAQAASTLKAKLAARAQWLLAQKK